MPLSTNDPMTPDYFKRSLLDFAKEAIDGYKCSAVFLQRPDFDSRMAKMLDYIAEIIDEGFCPEIKEYEEEERIAYLRETARGDDVEAAKARRELKEIDHCY